MSPSSHTAPAELSTSSRLVGAHPGNTAGCAITCMVGSRGTRLLRVRVPGGLFLALLRAGMLCICDLRVSASILRKGAVHTGMPPCPMPAGDRDWQGQDCRLHTCSCWRRNCSARCIVTLLSIFCLPPWHKGTWPRGSPSSHTASAEPAMGTALSYAHRAAVRDKLWVCSVELRLGQPLASHHQHWVLSPCWLPPGETH